MKEPKLTTGAIRIYEDFDRDTRVFHELIEVNFSDGSRVLMHKNQFDAISVNAAKMPATILYNAGEGPLPDYLKARTS